MYLEINPSTELKDSIDSFWIYSNKKSSEHFKVLPDGCTDLILDLNHGKNFLSGAMSIYQHIELEADSNLIGIRFKSENFGSLWDVPLDKVKNLTIEFSELCPIFDLRLMDELVASNSIEKKIGWIEACIAKALLRHGERRDTLIISIANKIRTLHGKVNVEALAKSYHISIRQLQRRFKHYIGLTLKEFANIIRFRHTIKSIRSNPKISFMQIAFNMGYYDHAHMNHEFNRIAGENPSYFR